MKRILMVVAILAGTMALPATVSATDPVGIWGDTNCTGDLDAADMLNVKRALIGLPPGPLADPCASSVSPTDLNCNGEMDSSDLVIIKRLLIGLPVTLPAGCPPPGWSM